MYCSKNIVSQALHNLNDCDKDVTDIAINCKNSCDYYVETKAELISKVYWLIQHKELTSKEITKVNGFIKSLV